MNRPRQTKLTRLFSHLKHVIQADDGGQVRRRNLLSSRHGDVQLELDLDSPELALNRRRWMRTGESEKTNVVL